MNNELSFYYYAGSSLVPALVAFGVIWWQNSKLPTPLGVAKLSIVFLTSFVACCIALAGISFIAQISHFENLDSLAQPLAIASGVVAYFAGKQFALRLSKQDK